LPDVDLLLEVVKVAFPLSFEFFYGSYQLMRSKASDRVIAKINESGKPDVIICCVQQRGEPNYKSCANCGDKLSDC